MGKGGRYFRKKDKNQKFFHYNFFLKNHKGLSTIIVTILILGLSFVALGVLWFVIKDLLNQGTGGIGLGRFTINIEIQKAYKSENNLVVDVQRKTGEGNLTGITFVLSNGTDKKTISQKTSLNPLDTGSFNLNLSQIALSNITKVSVAPIFESSSGKEIVGDVQNTYILQEAVQGGGNNNNNNNGNGNNNPGTGGGCTSLTDCPSGTVSCTGGVCVPQNCYETAAQTCTRLSLNCGSAVSLCGVNVFCPPGSSDGKCSSGLFCLLGTCTPVAPLNTGKIEDVWPPNSNIYFASKDLNKGVDQNPPIDYQGKYASFPGSSEINCRLIARYISYHDASTYGKTIIEFNFETAIKSGDNYKIWSSQEECTASL